MLKLMSDYNGNDIWNKYVLSSCLNKSWSPSYVDGKVMMLQ